MCAASLRSCLTKLYGVDNQIEDPLNELAGNHWGNWTEPTVWTGFPEDVNPDGTVRSSSAASWSTTFGRTGQNWNGRSANTSSFANGAWQIFGDECYDGSHVHDGFCTQLASCETGNTTCISMEQSNQLFNRVGVMFANWIQYSRKYLGIKVSLGTETPMTYPPQYGLPSQFDRAHPFNATVTQRLYEGLFLRLQRSGQTPDFFNIWCVPDTWLLPASSFSSNRSDMRAVCCTQDARGLGTPRRCIDSTCRRPNFLSCGRLTGCRTSAGCSWNAS